MERYTDEQIREMARKAIRDNDAGLAETDLSFMCQCVMLGALWLGADEAEIADTFGYDKEFVDQVGSRLRNAKIWIGDDVAEQERGAYADESGGISWGLDCNVAIGHMASWRDETGERRYQMTPAGTAHVEAMMKAKP